MRVSRTGGRRRSLPRLLAVALPALALSVAGFTAAPAASAGPATPAASHATSPATQNHKALTDPGPADLPPHRQGRPEGPHHPPVRHGEPRPASCFALRRTDMPRPAAASPRHALRPRPGRPAERLQPARDRRRRPDRRHRRRLRRPQRRGRPGRLPRAVRPAACTTANGCFKKVNQTGGTTSLPTGRRLGRGDLARPRHGLARSARTATSSWSRPTPPTDDDLGTAVNKAVALGAKYVSNSYGGGEDSGQTSDDAHYFNHPGVAITASSGDAATAPSTRRPRSTSPRSAAPR